jgi:putative modified peptide
MIKGSPSNDTIAKILDQLATSHDFREQMLGDPVAAMKAHGIEVAPNDVPATRSLPSMADIATMRDQFRANPQDKSCIAVFIVIGAK